MPLPVPPPLHTPHRPARTHRRIHCHEPAAPEMAQVAWAAGCAVWNDGGVTNEPRRFCRQCCFLPDFFRPPTFRSQPPPPHPPSIPPARPRCPTAHDALVPALTRALMRSRRAFFHAVGPQAAPPADRLCPRLIAPGARFYPGIGLSRHAGSRQIGRIFIKYFRSQAADKP